MENVKKIRKKLKQLKKSALVLYANGCITKNLCKKLLDTHEDNSEEYMHFLMDMCQEGIRVKGYYHINGRSNALCVNKFDDYFAQQLELFIRGCYKIKKGESP